jgi:hypothetical protein
MGRGRDESSLRKLSILYPSPIMSPGSLFIFTLETKGKNFTTEKISLLL